MAASARSTWRRPGSTRSAAASGNSASPTGSARSYFLMFGVAEDHDSNPIKIGLVASCKARGAKFVSVNPVRTGYSAIADEWIGIRPGTDGLFVLALVHELLRADKIDLDYPRAATPTRPGWWSQTRAAPMTGCSRATRDGAAAGLGPARAARRPARCGRTSQPALVGEFTLPDGRRARAGRSSCWPSAISIRSTRRTRWPSDCGIAGRRPSGASPPSSPRPPSSSRSMLDQPWTDWAGPPPRHDDRPAGRRCTRCAASRPIPTASTPAARCTCCRCCWARSIRRAASATSRPSRARSRRRSEAGRQARPGRSRQAAAAARRSASRTGPRICWSTPTARRGASTRRSPGRRRSPPHGLMHMVIAQRLDGRSRTRSTRCSCTWPTWPGTRR